MREKISKKKILPNKALIMVTWTPREVGTTLPDGKNSEFNYVDILIKHKQENNEERDIILLVNGPGFKPGQVDDLKNKFKGINGIHVIDLLDPKYDLYWKEIDQGWKINGNPISIKEYYRDMYSMEDEKRTYFAIEIDTFRYIAAYCVLREQKELKKDLGLIYFDALMAINGMEIRGKKGVGHNITIRCGVLAKREECACQNNDVFAITDHHILERIFNEYKGDILDQSEMLKKLKANYASYTSFQRTLLFGQDSSLSDIKILYAAQGLLVDGNMNLAQRSFISTVDSLNKVPGGAFESVERVDCSDEEDEFEFVEMAEYSDDEFDFCKNGGNAILQDDYRNDLSWIEHDIRTEIHKRSKDSTNPNTLLNVNSLENPVLSKNHPLVK